MMVFLFVAAMYDWKSRCIPGWLYLIGAAEAAFWRISCFAGKEDLLGWTEAQMFLHGSVRNLSFMEVCGGVGIGLLMLFASKASGGAVGSGDGLAFAVTGGCLGLWRNLLLLWLSLMLCSLWGIFWAAVKRERWKEAKKMELPFLPFAFFASIWVAML